MNDIIFRAIIPDQKILFKTLMLKGERGADGVSIVSFEKTSTVGLIDTYTITLNDGTTYTFEVKNGTNSAYDSALDAQSENAVQNKVIKSIIDAINSDISGIEGDITDIGTALTGIGQSITDIGTALSNRYTKSEVDNLLSRKADSDDLTANNIDYDNSTSMLSATDAQGAIDEVNTKADNAATASGTSYNNADSGLSATDMQAAIDELAQGGGGGGSSNANIAPDYDDTVTYNTNDKVIYNNLLYVCLENSVTGAWDSTKWQKISTADYNSSNLPISASDSTNTKDYIDTGLSGKEDILSTISGTITANTSGGWGVYGQLKRYGNVVSFYIDGNKSSALDSGWNTIGTLQSGFRPTHNFDFAMIDPGSDFASEGKVNTDGTIQVYKNANSTTRIRAQATFIV